jgi:ATP-binding cassette subfamily C (CFTR/MRP) protein 4
MLKNITLSINEGESWAFIGRIGCGKSTLLNALLFEIPAYKGSIKINGKEADKGELKIAYVE